MLDLVTAPDQITPARLTDLFRARQLTRSATIDAVHVLAHTSYHARTFQLQITWSHATDDPLPRSIFVKLLDQHRGRREVELYRYFLTEQQQLPILAPCYAAAYDPATGASHLILQDMSASHREIASRATIRAFAAQPSAAQIESVMEALARWHTHWWQHPLLGGTWTSVLEPLATEEHYRRYTREAQHAWQRFASSVGEWFPSQLLHLYDNLATNLPRLWQKQFQTRFAGKQNLTLVHGDCSFNQFLAPIHDPADQVVVIDFDSVRTDIPTADLVLLLATFWRPDQQRKEEDRALRHYHAALRAHGIDQYSWDELIDDYRLALAWQAIYPIWGMLDGEPQAFWWPRMECITAAYHRWRCDALFGA